MTIIVKFGRRVPRSFGTRVIKTATDEMALQETLWIMIKRSFAMAKKKQRHNTFNDFGHIQDLATTHESENEDMYNKILWFKVIIKGDKVAELKELEAIKKLYDSLGKVLKNKKIEVNENLGKVFNTEKLSESQVKEAIELGKEKSMDQSVIDKMLEIGVMSHIEVVEDW